MNEQRGQTAGVSCTLCSLVPGMAQTCLAVGPTEPCVSLGLPVGLFADTCPDLSLAYFHPQRGGQWWEQVQNRKLLN